MRAAMLSFCKPGSPKISTAFLQHSTANVRVVVYEGWYVVLLLSTAFLQYNTANVQVVVYEGCDVVLL